MDVGASRTSSSTTNVWTSSLMGVGVPRTSSSKDCEGRIYYVVNVAFTRRFKPSSLMRYMDCRVQWIDLNESNLLDVETWRMSSSIENPD